MVCWKRRLPLAHVHCGTDGCACCWMFRAYSGNHKALPLGLHFSRPCLESIYIYIYMSFAQDTVVDVEQFLTLVSTALAEIALGSPKTPNSLPPPGNWAQLQLK